jgi:hypothetical protein
MDDVLILCGRVRQDSQGGERKETKYDGTTITDLHGIPPSRVQCVLVHGDGDPAGLEGVRCLSKGTGSVTSLVNKTPRKKGEVRIDPSRSDRICPRPAGSAYGLKEQTSFGISQPL